jgi:bifunctional UDP-N-acetylglucosamine pyrophosphorylase/glucosamine-1-phosphate N-acetyltransferase
MRTLQAIILAAGKSSRFNTEYSKLLKKICGYSMISYPVKILSNLNIDLTVVVGYQKEAIQKAVREVYNKNCSFVIQETQLGTGHALLCTQSTWNSDDILIINGDMPLVTTEIIQQLHSKHIETNAALSFVIAHNPDPAYKQYGRVIKINNAIEIIEGKNFTGDSHEHCCINAGIYIAKKEFLDNNIRFLQKNNISQEIYLTDLVKIAHDKNYTVTTIAAPFDLIRGVNTPQEFCIAEQIKHSLVAQQWAEKGIQIASINHVYIDTNVHIGAGSYIGYGTRLLDGTIIGTHSRIEEYSILTNVLVGNYVVIKPFSIIAHSTIQSHVHIGPFAHIQEKTSIGEKSIIGNFVEIKRSSIGTHTKAKHLTYLGDATIGNNVNIGAGTITCNHNGFYKNKTTINDNAYIGSNSILVAPITINKNAITGAGSVITNEVPENALGIARSHQVNKLEYAHKLRQKNSKDYTLP